MKTFTPYKVKDIEIKNRIVMPPMCMYVAEDGLVNDFHITHYETRAIGGVGLIVVEATGVTPEGRISDHDLGIWTDEQIPGLKKVTDRIKAHGAVPAIQLSHSGRKSECVNVPVFAPSAIPYDEKSPMPKELSVEEIHHIVNEFKDGAARAVEAGFDMIEIHGAHGYLVSEFLSPITNKRIDSYGGSTENRTRFLKEIIGAVKSVVPKDMPLILRVSASDHVDDGMDLKEMIQIIDLVKKDLDLVHVSTGGLLPVAPKVYPGYQLEYAERIKKSCGVDTISVGLITTIEMIEEALMNSRCDLVACGRLLLRNPYFPVQEAAKAGLEEALPKPYVRGFNTKYIN